MSAAETKTTRLLQLYPLNAREPTNSQLIEDLLEFVGDKHSAVRVIIKMLKDLHKHGHKSKYVKKLAGLAVSELKPNPRGGHKGGARVYFAFTQNGDALLFNAEVKNQDQTTPDPAKIEQAYEMLHAYLDGELKYAPHS